MTKKRLLTSTSIKTIFKTSMDDGHRHNFVVGHKRTRMNYDHLHPINYRTGIALPTKKAPHSHNISKSTLKVLKLLKAR